MERFTVSHIIQVTKKITLFLFYDSGLLRETVGEFGASVEGDKVEKIAISESFTRLFITYFASDDEITQILTV
jgi:hypothetical protein